MQKLMKAAVFALVLSLLLAGCGGGKGDVIPEESSSSRMSIKSSSSTAPALPPEPELAAYNSAIGISFEYPDDCTVETEGNLIAITAPSEQDYAIIVADISYEVSLFLAGHGDIESSIDALVNKYADALAGDSVKENYEYIWDPSPDGNIRAGARYTYESNGKSYAGTVDAGQVGSRVILGILIAPGDDRQEDAKAVYQNLNMSLSIDGTDGELLPANLSDLGFPEARSGFERFYSPVTGQFFVYPEDWTIVNNIHDDSVILFNDEGALMLTENWTDTFFENWNSNGNDIEDCFEQFLNECAGALEQIYSEVPAYHDFQLMATENQELIKATFNYTVSQGTGRCFAELGYREFDGKEYVQATLCLYKVGDSYSIDLFSIIMDSIMIYYPTLA